MACQFAVELELAVGCQPAPKTRELSRILQLQAHSQDAFGCTAQHGEQSMRRDLADRFLVVDIQFEFFGFGLLATFDLGADLAVRHRLLDHPSARIGIFRPLLSDDIKRSLQSRFGIRNICERGQRKPAAWLAWIA